jgi:hypothetical protein
MVIRMKRSRALINLTNATNQNLIAPPVKGTVLQHSFTPSENSNNEGDNSVIDTIEGLERYIKDNYTIIIQENKPTNGNALKISIKPRKYKRISDGKIFNRVYSSEANLWYPDGDNYVMDILGVKNDNNTNIPVNIKRLKLRKTRAKEARRQRQRRTRKN